MTDRAAATIPRHDLDELVARCTPGAVAAARPRMAAAAELLGWSLKSGVDLTATFVREVPVLSLSAVLGIPIDDQRAVFGWADAGTEDALERYGRELVALRRDVPGPDLVSMLLAHRAHADAVGSSVGPWLVDGTATSRHLLARALRSLAARPDAWERVAAAPDHADAVLRALPGATSAFGDHAGRAVARAGLVALTGQLTAVELAGEPLRLKFRRRPE